MKILLLSLFLLQFSTICGAEIFKTIDENGNVVFSNKPKPGNNKSNTNSVITIKKTEKITSEQKLKDRLKAFKEKKSKAVSYKKFAIILPKNDQAVRNNMGTIEVKLQIDPPLQVKFGHHIKIKFDGKMLKSQWKSRSVLFNNLDRGTHSVQAFLFDKAGKRLKSSKTSTFHLKRFSRLFN